MFLKFFRYAMFSEMKQLIILARSKILQEQDMPELPKHLNPRFLPIREENLKIQSAKDFVFSLFREGKPFLLPTLALNFGFVLLNLTKPVLVNQFIARVSSLQENKYLVTTVILAVLLGLVSFISSLAMQHYFLRSLHAVQIFTNAINRLIYKHSLLLTQRAKSETQLGDVVNHMSSDCDAVSDLPLVIGELQLSLVTIIGACGLLFYYLGFTAFLSVGLLLLMVPLTRKVAKSFSSLDEELMKHRDQRVTLMSQILNGIRIVKFYAWEKSVEEEVQKIRTSELLSRKKLARAEALATLSYVAVSTVVLFASLSLHVSRGFALTPELAFTCVAIFTILEDPFGHLSELISKIASGTVSAGRISQFLRREKMMNILASVEPENVLPGVEIENLSVIFDGAKTASLSNIHVKILPGESVAIVGPVGSGKSTLLQAILKEVPFHEGTISFLDLHRKGVQPRLAYVPQEAFIINGSLKENILFGREESPEILAESIFASCLENDLKQLPAGLFTEIGEKGVNLSGGQKQRVSLARSIMHQPKLVLLDDPLSAVDSRTEAQLVDRLLFGVWKDITRVMVSHRLSNLDRFDKIIFLVEGKIAEVGTLEEILKRSKAFEAFYADSAKAEHGISLQAESKEVIEKKSPTEEKVQENRITEDEDRAVGAVKTGVYLDYAKALGGITFRHRLILLPLLFLTSTLAATLPMLQKSWLALSSNVQSGKIAQESTRFYELASQSIPSILVYGLLGFLTLGGVLVNRLFWLERGMAAGKNMHNQMLRAVLKAPLRFFDSTPIGRILQRFSRDVESVDIHLQWSFEMTVRCLVHIGTALFLILGVMPLMLVVVLPVLALYYRVQKDYRVPAREAKRLDSISRSPRFAHFKETLQGLVVIRSFGKSHTFLEMFFQKLEHSQRMFHGHYMLNRWFSSRIPLLGGFVASTTGLGITFYAYHGWISPGLAGLITVYALSLWEYLNWAVRVFAEVEARMTSVERLKFYSSVEPEKDIFLPTPNKLRDTWPEKGEVVFDSVQVRYAAHLPPVLKGISFRIPAGSRVGIIGRTGSGKSTLLQALYRCMELEQGEIRMDGINIASVPLEKLRRNMAIIPQDPTLFLGSLRSNLDRYSEHTDEEIWNSLKQARLFEFVQSLPNGLLAQVKENGANFSQGQRQLICLARALLTNARVIVMDEATASVDVQTDGLVQEVVRESCQDVTMLIIAHRLGTVADCDLILEVKEGKLHRTLNLQNRETELLPC
jgi:ABC-type multidrug transport system fused ATPase/permease subunit